MWTPNEVAKSCNEIETNFLYQTKKGGGREGVPKGGGRDTLNQKTINTTPV